ncbi:MAG: hypothetical protein EF813_00390 [Methanosarcinales archaeon]|nr:MAG: hypothetical protein EF813_00390 [Methanosarcinales archaeon]
MPSFCIIQKRYFLVYKCVPCGRYTCPTIKTTAITINVAFIGTVSHASITPVHGKASEIHHDKIEIYERLPNPFTGGRYHSLAVDHVSPDILFVAHSPDGIVMGIRHKQRQQIEGVRVPSRVSADAGRAWDDQEVCRGSGW